MSIPYIESFQLHTSTKDKYGKITSSTDVTYYGVIERETQFRGANPASEIGKGIIFCSDLEGLVDVGQEVIVDGEVLTIVKYADLKDLGNASYHHTELVYA